MMMQYNSSNKHETFVVNENGPVYGKQKKEQEQMQKQSKEWNKIGTRILKESKKSMMPSIDYINHRLNLFRQQIDEPDIFEILQKESEMTNQFTDKRNISVSDTEKMKQRLHNLAEKRIKNETGDVKYYSYKKNIQLSFKIDKEQKQLFDNMEKKKQKE